MNTAGSNIQKQMLRTNHFTYRTYRYCQRLTLDVPQYKDVLWNLTYVSAQPSKAEAEKERVREREKQTSQRWGGGEGERTSVN